MTYHRRSAWTSAPKTGSRLKRDQTEIYVHWPASAGKIGTSTEAIKSYLRSWHRLHTKDRGWSDIAYNLGVDQNGDIWELRGIDRQCGGNGGTVTNRRGQAILAIMGMGETPSAAMIQGIRDAVSRIRREHPQARKILGHRDSFEASTSCPGTKLYALVKSGAFEPGKGGIPSPGTSVPVTRPSVPSAEFADVDKTQRWLAELGYDPGPIDGKYGTKTAAATRAFQTYWGLTADGRPGPTTRTALEEAMTIKDDITYLTRVAVENQKRIGQVPAAILDAPIKLAGQDAGKTSSLRTKAAYEAHEHRVTQQQIAALRGELAGLEHALRAVDSGEALDLDQVRAAAREGVDQALGSLEVTVSKGD